MDNTVGATDTSALHHVRPGRPGGAPLDRMTIHAQPAGGEHRAIQRLLRRQALLGGPIRS